MKHSITVFVIILISFISNAFFTVYVTPALHIQTTKKSEQIIKIPKDSDKVVIVKDGKYFTYFGKILEENDEYVNIKTTLILEGIK